MKQISLLLALTCSILSFSQVNFEKAYFIDNSNNKTECLIKNVEWRSNPTSFQYKTDQSSEIKTAAIEGVKSFEILHQVKYVRSNVQIDKSPHDLNNLSPVKEPVFVEEQLFLKELVHGNSNLYKYQNGNLIRYFFQIGEGPIEQLVYKFYKKEHNTIGYNMDYQQQLQKNLNCSVPDKQIEKIEYKEKPLTEFFINYNKCTNPDAIQIVSKANKGLFNLNIRPRINFSSLSLENAEDHLTADMNSKISFSIGLEAEYVFPFNKNKWALVIEPTYQYYKSQNIQDVNFLVGGKMVTNVNYKSIEIPIGIRHYMFIDQKSKIFINAQYVIDLAMNSYIETARIDNSVYLYTKVNSNPSFAAGIGYNYNNKFGVEIRQLFGRNDYSFWTAKYNNTAIIFSYKIL